MIIEEKIEGDIHKLLVRYTRQFIITQNPFEANRKEQLSRQKDLLIKDIKRDIVGHLSDDLKHIVLRLMYLLPFTQEVNRELAEIKEIARRLEV